MSERRQFVRFEISEDAIALDAHGHRLGRVTAAGGGGMAIRLDEPSSVRAGEMLRVTIVEPGPGAKHTIDIVVRYINEDSLGAEFVTGEAG